MQILNVSYSTIKTIIKSVPTYYLIQGDGEYDVFSVCTDFLVRCRVISDSDITDFSENYLGSCTAVSSADDALVLGQVANGVPLVQPRTPDGRVKIAQEKTDGERINFFSVDYSDVTTWYPNSIYVSGETATDDGDHLNFSLAFSPVIDNYHGKISAEDSLIDSDGNSYRVSVSVMSSGSLIQMTEQDPHYASGGDYIVDYVLGKITFLSPRDPSDQVIVSYHYVDTVSKNGNASRFTVAAPQGKKMSLEIAECQFSTDIDMRDTIIYEAWGIADFFLTPSQMEMYGIPPGIGYKIRLNQVKYKALSDFQNDAFKAYPTYPAMGNPDNWRAQKQPVTVFDWDYLTSIELKSSSGMEIRVYLEHDEPYDGWMAVATFYCKMEDEK